MTNRKTINAMLDQIAARDSNSRTMTLAHQAANELATCQTQQEMKSVLETFEVEPLDCLYSLIGSYIEDRARRDDLELTEMNHG